MTEEHLALAEGTAHSQADWEKAAAAVLRKAGRLSESSADSGVWEALTRTTLDGIGITPLGTPGLVADSASNLASNSGAPAAQRVGGWDIRPLFTNPDPAVTAAQILTDLENGATSVWLRLGEGGQGGFSVTALGGVLKPVLLDAAAVVLDAPEDPIGAAQAFADLAAGGSLAPGTNLGLDPISAQLSHPNSDGAGEADLSQLREAARIANELGSLALVVDGSALHDLGASAAQELGYAMASAATYLRVLGEEGYDAAAAAALIEFRLAATNDQFQTIAKFRSARRVWARMLELSGVEEQQRGMRLHAVTSRPMMTKYDPWVNMLRTCVAAFSAGVGGADAITVLPFDARLGLPNAFSRRIARNTSSLLIEEAHVARVADPAAGAFAVEKFTEDLAIAGWRELDQIEAAGGVVRALVDGSIQFRVQEVVSERDRQIAVRARPLTGVTEFPHLGEDLPEREPDGGSMGAVRPYAHAFEALRDRPAPQQVFLATMGSVAAHTARASFATNLFASGGVDVLNCGAHDGLDAVLSSYDGQAVVCLVGTDLAYADWGAELASALRGAGATRVILAGTPGEESVPAEALDDSCARGVDAWEFLTRNREFLGIEGEQHG